NGRCAREELAYCAHACADFLSACNASHETPEHVAWISCITKRNGASKLELVTRDHRLFVCARSAACVTKERRVVDVPDFFFRKIHRRGETNCNEAETKRCLRRKTSPDISSARDGSGQLGKPDGAFVRISLTHGALSLSLVGRGEPDAT